MHRPERRAEPAATILRVDDPRPNIGLRPEEGDWNSYFSAVPHSNDRLRELIPPAVATLDSMLLDKSTKHWELPHDLPIPVIAWFRGQKQILFADIPISAFEDIQQLASQSEPASLVQIFRDILIHEQKYLALVKDAHQGYWHSRFDGHVVELCCSTCEQPQTLDTNSRWATTRPGCYISRRLVCHSKICRGKSKWAKPADESDRVLRLLPPHQTASSSSLRIRSNATLAHTC